ncbi:MAG: hypothetical protein KGL92_15240 [Gammaproteobacteria bacterium]|nr:hypothetical protein [Gammaproteobacteria bacterium]
MKAAIVSRWTREPLLSVELARSLRDLNAVFLELEGVVAARLAALSPAQRAIIANCPYALFDLRFHDHEHWRRNLRGAGGCCVAETPAGEQRVVAFVRVVLFYAWHLATTARHEASLLFGIPESTADVFAETSPAQLMSIAAMQSVNLSARWSHCEAYWGSLADAAERADRANLRRVQLSGLQLVAAARLP